MEMTESEIVRSYQEAKHKSSQLEILAELNGCDKETIKQCLRNNGIEPRERKPRQEERQPEPIPIELAQCIIDILANKLAENKRAIMQTQEFVAKLEEENREIERLLACKA